MIRDETITTGELAEAACCELPALSADEQKLALALVDEIAKGRPVATDQLAKAMGMTSAATEAVLDHEALRPLLYRDEAGQILAYGGLTGIPTRHQLTVDGQKLWAWCAVDSLLHPQLLGKTIVVESHDPETNALVRLTVSPMGVESVEPSDAVVSWNNPETWDSSSASTMRASACSYVFFFASPASAKAWQSKHQDTVLLSVDQAFSLGRDINEHLFGSELARRQALAA